MGAMNMQARKSTAVVRAVRPVRPPASTPEPDSIKVVTVEVPVQAPATVPIASASRASFICGILPSLSSISALAAVNEALRKGEANREETMNKMAPGMGGMGGMGGLF